MGKFSSFLRASKANKNAGKITAISLAGAGVDGVSTFAFDRMEDPNGSMAGDLLHSAGTAAAWLLAEPLMWGITIGQAAVGGVKMAWEESEENRKLKASNEYHVRKDASGSMGGELGGNFQDSQQAYTMRQRQMDLLRQHRMSTEAVLGSEARQLHR